VSSVELSRERGDIQATGRFSVALLDAHVAQTAERARAIRLAEVIPARLARHAGALVHLYTPTGRKTVARGRDLTACRWVIGTGGALTRLPGGEEVLAATRAAAGGPAERLLPPADARVALDRDYVFACCGVLLAHFDGAAVVRLMRGSLGD
jgi:hypothetical protein